MLSSQPASPDGGPCVADACEHRCTERGDEMHIFTVCDAVVTLPAELASGAFPERRTGREIRTHYPFSWAKAAAGGKRMLAGRRKEG